MRVEPHMRSLVVAAALLALPTLADSPSHTIDLTNCSHCGPTLGTLALFAMAVLFAPVGAFVMRRHIASATGVAWLAGKILQVAALASLPIIILVFASWMLMVLVEMLF